MAEGGYRERLYAEYFATSGYSDRNPVDDESYETRGRILRQILRPYLPADRAAAILDVACGTGYAVELMIREGYSNVRGIDLSADQVLRAKERGLPVEQADAFDFLADVREQLDVVVAFDFIEHLRRDELFAFLDAARQSLRLGGRLIVKTPNASCLFGARSRYLDLTHEIAFTEKSLRAAFAAASLQTVAITGERIRPFTLKGWVRWVPANLVRLLWKAYLISELAEEGFSIPTEFNLIGVAERAPLT